MQEFYSSNKTKIIHFLNHNLDTTLSALRVKRNITEFVETKLHLKVNEAKSNICRPIAYFILGYGFVPTYKKGEKGKYNLRVSPKSFKRLKQKVRKITRKTSPMTFSERILKLNSLTRGWINYYRFAGISGKLRDLDTWIRNRLRYCIWKSRTCGRRSPINEREVLSDWVSQEVRLMLGLALVWVVGQ